ncbi:MAG: primosomal protein N' [Patescibacteria group bacterium]|nr:primosomal protein N' [Patescibacteria group bacterium]
MRLQIIPILRLPLSLPALDYSADDNLAGKIKIGQLVRVPFRRHLEYGIVSATTASNEELAGTKIKPIDALIFAEPFIAPAQLNFLTEIANFYRAPLGFVLKTALFILPKRAPEKMSEWIVPFHAAPAAPSKPKLISCVETTELKKQLKKIAALAGQRLILVPEINQLEKIAEFFPKKTIIVGGEQTAKAYRKLWLAVRSQPDALVIGTRKALFLPWTNLTAVALTDEGNSDYKSWDMAPRFHTRDAAMILTKHTGAQLFFLTATPSVETYYFAKKNVYDAPGPLVAEIKNNAPIFIDLKMERRGGNQGAVAEDILKAVAKTDGDAFFFINRRASANFILCQDCGHVFYCDNCRRPMAYYQKNKELNCHFCKRRQALPLACPACQSVSYRLLGLGTDGVAAELEKIFPHGDRLIIALDKLNPEALKKLGDHRPKIIVGTQFAWNRLDWKKIKIMAMVDPDAELSIPEYKAAEEMWQTLRAARTLLEPEAKLYLQTSRPEHRVFQGMYRPEEFYEAELNERHLLNYPPFNYLIRLYCGHAEKHTAESAGHILADKIAALTRTLEDVKMSGPLDSSPPYWRHNFWQIILLKLNYKNFKQRAGEVLKIVPEEWKVDPNPNNIISIG